MEWSKDGQHKWVWFNAKLDIGFSITYADNKFECRCIDHGAVPLLTIKVTRSLKQAKSWCRKQLKKRRKVK